MKQQLSNSTYLSIGYFVVILFFSGFIYFALTDGFCSLIHWLSDTCETRISTVNN